MATHRQPQQLSGQLLHRPPLGAVRREYHVVVKVETEPYAVELRASGEQGIFDNDRRQSCGKVFIGPQSS